MISQRRYYIDKYFEKYTNILKGDVLDIGGKEENKRDPVVVDIHLKGNTARRQASNRIGHYMKQGYEIKQL